MLRYINLSLPSVMLVQYVPRQSYCQHSMLLVKCVPTKLLPTLCGVDPVFVPTELSSTQCDVYPVCALIELLSTGQYGIDPVFVPTELLSTQCGVGPVYLPIELLSTQCGVGPLCPSIGYRQPSVILIQCVPP